MKTKQDQHITILRIIRKFSFAFLLFLTACGSQDDPLPETDNKVQLSDTEITLEVDGWKPLSNSRAIIFESENDFLDDASTAKGGGIFTMYAYLKETGSTFIGGSRVWYFVPDNATVGSWRFYDEANNHFPQYYWPQSNSVDFFAYMPWKGSDRQKKITVDNYVQGTGLTINCRMQEPTTLLDTDGQETIIAYTTNKSKADKKVNMCFVHPFSAVYFKLHQAHRDLTINWIRFNDVYLTGSTTLNATTDNSTPISWTGTGSIDEFNIPVNQTIPDQINFGGDIGGPYLVMPQNLGGATITINYTWENANPSGKDDVVEGDEDSSDSNNVYQIKRTINAEWIAGNKYTYVLDLGDNQAEILFKVLVEPWDVEGYKNIVDVE